MSHPATVRFPVHEFRQLERLAQKRGVTVSELIRSAVRAHYFHQNKSDAVKSLVEFIDAHPFDIDNDVEGLESAIESSARRDATPR